MSSAQQEALRRIEESLEYLDIAIESATTPQALAAEEKESIQAEISANWEQHCESLEGDLATLRDELETLRNENTKLSNELQELQQDYIDLQQVTDTVHTRLDSSIKQMDMLIDERKEEAVA